jgi:hypothetical protein
MDDKFNVVIGGRLLHFEIYGRSTVALNVNKVRVIKLPSRIRHRHNTLIIIFIFISSFMSLLSSCSDDFTMKAKASGS